MKNPKNPFQPFDRIGTTGGLPGGDPVQRRMHGPAILLGALAILGLILVGSAWWGGPDEAQAGTQEAASGGLQLDAPRTPLGGAPKTGDAGQGGTQGSARAGLGSDGSSTASHATQATAPERTSPLRKPVERIVAKWLDTARKHSKGKVTAGNTVVSIHVRDLEGRVWLSRDSQESLPPASNLKLLTVASAAILAGPDAQFETHFEAGGPIRGGVLQGDLIVRAGADPMFDPDDRGSLDRWMTPLVQQLRAAGIERVDGRLVLDEGDYLIPSPGPAWPSENEYWKEYCALSGGFNANAGCLTSVVSATQVGQQAQVRVRPAGHGLTQSKGTVKTVAKGEPLDVRVGAMPRLVVKGKVPANYSAFTSRFAHPDPVELFGHAVIQALQSRGIPIQAKPHRERGVPAGEQVAVLRTPLLESYGPILMDSNNAVADQLYWWLGHTYGERGDRLGGARAVAAALGRLGVDSDGWQQVDGSGLSKNNRARADQITALLAGVLQAEGPAAEAFRRTLPVAGQSGTLRKRMRQGLAAGNVRAKTGFVNGTSALSGTVQTSKRTTLVFSILVRYPYAPGLNTKAFKPMQDELCELLAGWNQELGS